MFTQDTWDVIESYFVQHQGEAVVKYVIDSYNDFVHRKLGQIIENFNKISVYHHYIPDKDMFEYQLDIEMHNPLLTKPMIHEKDGSTKIMTPNDARQRNFSYSGTLYVDVHFHVSSVKDGQVYHERKIIKKVNIGKIPIMLRSNYCILKEPWYQNQMRRDECAYDYGGYFIVNGNEKVVVSQDRISENKTYVFLDNKLSCYSHIAEIRSVPDGTYGPHKLTSLKLSIKPNQYGRYIRASIHHIRHDIPICILFRALGITSDKEILEHICYDLSTPLAQQIANEMKGSIDEGNQVNTPNQALEYLSRYLNISGYPREILQSREHRLNIIRDDILRNDFLPHVGEDYGKKALYLGYMVNRLFRAYFKLAPLDDRDSYINKRVETPGILIANLFRQYYGKLIRDMKTLIYKEVNSGPWKANNDFLNVVNANNIYKLLKSTTIEVGLKYCFSTGNWGIRNNINKTKQGVAQVLSRLTYNAMLSHLRRISTPMEKTGKLVQPRKLHSTQWGIICPAETPEGGSVGLVKNLAIMALVTVASNSMIVKEYAKNLGVVMYTTGMNLSCFAHMTHVIINGDLIGVHAEPYELYTSMKDLKTRGIINIYTGVVWDIIGNVISICTDGGRCVRPLYIVDNGTDIRLTSAIIQGIRDHKLTWNDLMTPHGSQNGAKYGLTQSVIEYMDVEEGNLAMIAMRYKDLEKGVRGHAAPVRYTHLEIHPSLMLGVLANNIPFPEHNQAPRNCYQCLWAEEPVLMADGSRKQIQKVSVGDEVVCFDDALYPQTTRVVDCIVRSTDKVIHRLTTISGRTITVTADHKMFTEIGWMEAGKVFASNARVGIFIANDAASNVGDYKPIVTKPRLITSDMHIVPILARIFGFMCGEGGVIEDDVLYAHFAFEIDTKSFEADIAALGFATVDPFVDKEANAWCVSHNDVDLIEFLEAVFCNKTWINEGSDLVKREYLAGIQGACGGRIAWDDEAEEGPRFAMELYPYAADLFAYFGVNGDNDDASLINYFDKIGYRYAWNKTVMSAMSIEYMKAQALKHTSNMGRIKVSGHMMFVPLASDEIVDNCMIADITVESEHHNFIGGNNFAVHNCSMGKQAIGLYATNFRNRMDTLGNVLNYPQLPLVSTKIAKFIHMDDMPSGINVIVAIATFTGYNQEDSIILNKSAVERGLFNSTFYRSYKEHCVKNHSTGEEEVFCRPPINNTKGLKPYNYAKLEEDGFVKENMYVEAGDVLIGKCMPQKVNDMFVYKDNSVIVKNNEMGYIDRNGSHDRHFKNVNSDGYTFSKVRVRNFRTPVIGDKLACYTPDTDILTTRGWVPFPELTLEDSVASMVGDALVYQKPEALHQFDHEGKMYLIQSNQVDLCVTPNHRMLVKSKYPGSKYKVMTAEEVHHKRLKYKKNVDVWEPKLDVPDLPWNFIVDDGVITHFRFEEFVDGHNHLKPEVVIDIDSWITLYGIYVAEGTVALYHISIAANKPRVQEALTSMSESTGLMIRKNIQSSSPNHERLQWNVCNTNIARFIGMGHISTNKRLMNWVWFLNRNQCQKLIHSMCLGDGGEMKNGTWRYYTSSTGLANDFQRLCLHAGWSCNKKLKSHAGQSSVIKQTGQVITSNEDYWVLTIITSQNEPLVNKNMPKKPFQDDWIDYNGKVYCCTMQGGDGTVYVRRNGMVVWSKNSRHAQKGTVGMTYKQEDMPFTQDGLIPDIIINPHCIPSRMTIGQLMETLLGKACVDLGTYGDATPFNDVTVEDLAKQLDACGMERYGNEIMYNPRTGEQMPTSIFVGPTYYQRLKHMVADKTHSRNSNGPVVLLTRQPAEGRAREGGLRMGEMEVECNWAHGTLQFLKERLMECSDNYRVFVCGKCGMMANVNPDKGVYMCRPCQNNTDFVQLRIPYACKLLFQEIQCLGIGAKFGWAGSTHSQPIKPLALPPSM
jgi:DNA-directed RNA polymerase beta subunit